MSGADEPDEAPAPPPDDEGAEPAASGAAASGDEPQLPEPDLQTHLFHLASQVSMALGDLKNPVTGDKQVDLRAARFLIDTIAMLEEKTRGNRTPEEDAYVTGVLANLRMAYVSKSK